MRITWGITIYSINYLVLTFMPSRGYAYMISRQLYSICKTNPSVIGCNKMFNWDLRLITARTEVAFTYSVRRYH